MPRRRLNRHLGGRMLVVTRRLGESITIGDNIKVTVLMIKGKQVRIGVEAPKDLQVDREEPPKEPTIARRH